MPDWRLRQPVALGRVDRAQPESRGHPGRRDLSLRAPRRSARAAGPRLGACGRCRRCRSRTTRPPGRLRRRGTVWCAARRGHRSRAPQFLPAGTAVVAGAVWAAACSLLDRLSRQRLASVARIATAGLALTVGMLLVIALATSDPVDSVHREARAFVKLEPDPDSGTRFASGSGNRYDYWRVACDPVRRRSARRHRGRQLRPHVLPGAPDYARPSDSPTASSSRRSRSSA